MFCTNKEKQKAFTLIELMVVLVIMVALAILVISGYSEGRPRFSLEISVEGFARDFRQARERSFSGVFYAVGEDDEEIVVGDYGLLVKKNEENYILFIYTEDGMWEIEEIELERYVKISAIEIKEGNTSIAEPEELSVRFSVADKKTYFYFNNNWQTDKEAYITFSAKEDENMRRTVSIDSSGIGEIIHEYD